MVLLNFAESDAMTSVRQEVVADSLDQVPMLSDSVVNSVVDTVSTTVSEAFEVIPDTVGLPTDSAALMMADSVTMGAAPIVASDSLGQEPQPTVSRTAEQQRLVDYYNSLPAWKRKPAKEIEVKEVKEPFWRKPYPNSTFALLFSILPGGGQIYNQQFWKVPVAWGITVGCVYAITSTQKIYHQYHTAYVDFMSDDPMSKDSWKIFVPPGADPADHVGSGNIESQLRKSTTDSKLSRDLSITFSVVAYLLCALDAYVDAELYNFDVSPNLSMNIQPMAMRTPNQSLGVQWALTF